MGLRVCGLGFVGLGFRDEAPVGRQADFLGRELVDDGVGLLARHIVTGHDHVESAQPLPRFRV